MGTGYAKYPIETYREVLIPQQSSSHEQSYNGVLETSFRVCHREDFLSVRSNKMMLLSDAENVFSESLNYKYNS